MFQAIRRHVNATSVVAFIALVFALTGGAFAASGHGGSPAVATATAAKSKAKPKAKAGPRGPAGPAGKNGAQGPAGPTGPAGATGPQGSAGAKGETGAQGTPGTPGVAGTSVTSTSIAASPSNANCKEGGGEFKAGAGTTYACNGSPWTVGGLPKGASERGAWSATGFYKASKYIVVPISFNVPLAKALEAEDVHFIALGHGAGEGSEEAKSITDGECTGTYANPGAASGQLCVFESFPGTLLGEGTIGTGAGGYQESQPPINSPETRSGGAGISGAYMLGVAEFGGPTTEGNVISAGDWVVTG